MIDVCLDFYTFLIALFKAGVQESTSGVRPAWLASHQEVSLSLSVYTYI